jgi:hypothetical protein
MSWHFSQALVEGFLEENSLDGTAFALWKSMPIAHDDSSSGKMKGTCHVSPYGMMFVPSMDSLGAELLIWALEGSRAKASPLPVTGQGWITKSLASGAIRPVSLARLDFPTCGLKTHQHSLFAGGFESLESLPRWGMIVAGELYRLPTPSGLMELRASITSESGSGLPERFPTATASNSRSSGSRNLPGSKAHAGVSLTDKVRTGNSVTPRVPTPKAAAAGADFAKMDRSGTGLSLQTVVAMSVPRIPTPKSEDGQCSGGHRDKDDTLYGMICRPKRIPTPTTQDASNNGPASQQERNTKPLNAEVGGPLNPDWVEWLMGWPIGWTDSKPLGTDRFRLWLNSHGRS